MKFPSLPTQQLQYWAHLNGVSLHGVQIRSNIIDADGVDRGGGLVATQDHAASTVLLSIPPDLVLNKARVEDAAKSDKHLRDLLRAVGPTFSQTPRTIIMIFLLVQLTHTHSESVGKVVGVTNPLTDYVNFLPKNIPLPTMYDAYEQDLLAGTSLEAALKQKNKRLESEFDHLRTSTADIDWCQDIWWNEGSDALTIDNWKAIDAMYRSRALELPHGVGDAMVPVLDMANHASAGKYNARFELDLDSGVQLVVHNDHSIKTGDEINIMYGFGGACETVFSYGFLDKDTQRAREMFLDLEIPVDDPLRRAKYEVAKEASGVHLFTDKEGHFRWESSFVWWACVNQEDGLDFRILQQTDGATELRAIWGNSDLEANNLKNVLMRDSLWDVFLLRAIVLIQNRVEAQGVELSRSQEMFESVVEAGDGSPVMETLGRLRDLEMELLAEGYQALESEKALSLDTDAVREYLSKQDPDRTDGVGENEDTDFS